MKRKKQRLGNWGQAEEGMSAVQWTEPAEFYSKDIQDTQAVSHQLSISCLMWVPGLGTLPWALSVSPRELHVGNIERIYTFSWLSMGCNCHGLYLKTVFKEYFDRLFTSKHGRWGSKQTSCLHISCHSVQHLLPMPICNYPYPNHFDFFLNFL